MTAFGVRVEQASVVLSVGPFIRFALNRHPYTQLNDGGALPARVWILPFVVIVCMQAAMMMMITMMFDDSTLHRMSFSKLSNKPVGSQTITSSSYCGILYEAQCVFLWLVVSSCCRVGTAVEKVDH